jgi:sulfopyruvate decarboxylase TPP-binding subunit
MYDGEEIVSILTELGVTHVVWVPDSALGPWEEALEASPSIELVRVCREGEAWPIAAGLMLGGKTPLVAIQTTGLFESGDALRNAVFDFNLPLFAIVGARSWLVENSTDSAKRFAQPVLDAWGLDYQLIEKDQHKPRLAEHYRRCRAAGKPGAVLVAEGRM